jgi:hypothetical protein
MCRAWEEGVDGRHAQAYADDGDVELLSSGEYLRSAELLSSRHLLACDPLSSTHLLIDECIANVRQTARLDDDAVLPPLPVVAPRRDVVILTKVHAAGSAASSAASSTPDETAGDVVGVQPSSRRLEGTHRVSRRSGPDDRASRWALVLCAVVAGSFATASFLASPAGHKPSVVRVRDGARSRASHAVHATAALFTR